MFFSAFQSWLSPSKRCYFIYWCLHTSYTRARQKHNKRLHSGHHKTVTNQQTNNQHKEEFGSLRGEKKNECRLCVIHIGLIVTTFINQSLVVSERSYQTDKIQAESLYMWTKCFGRIRTHLHFRVRVIRKNVFGFSVFVVTRCRNRNEIHSTYGSIWFTGSL